MILMLCPVVIWCNGKVNDLKTSSQLDQRQKKKKSQEFATDNFAMDSIVILYIKK